MNLPHHGPNVTHRETADSSFRMEIFRKLIHLSSISIPVFYFFTPRVTALIVAASLTVAAVLIDIGRHRSGPVKSVFDALFGSVLRHHETRSDTRRLNGGTYVLIAATLSILIFPKLIAITGFLILILSDLAAALIGKKFGSRRFLGKTLEGSTAFFIVALVVIAATPKVEYAAGEYLVGCVAALAGTIVEALPTRVDDNLSIPLSVGFVLWGGYLLLLPHLDIFTFG